MALRSWLSRSLMIAGLCATAAHAAPAPVDTLPSDFPPPARVAVPAADFVVREA